MHFFNTLPVTALVGLVACAGLIVFQIVSAVRLGTRLQAAAEMAARLDRLTAALGLLTDTTEGGLSALSAEIERLGRRTVVSSRDSRKTGAASRREDFSQAALDAALAAGESGVHLGAFTSRGDDHAGLRA